MRAAVQTGIGRMEIRDVPAPEPGPGEIVVAVRAALTCGTDRKILDRGHEKLTPPLVMGHEFSGDVARAGEGAPFREGDAVMVALSGPCGTCAECRSGSSNRCESGDRELVWGAFAEEVRVPRRVAAGNVLRKPRNVSYETAAFLDPLSCVAHGAARLNLSDNESVLVLGVGAIGLLWIAAARNAGARPVVAVGRGRERLEAARRLGAAVFEPPAREAPATDVVVECVGRPEAWEEAFERVRPGGVVLFFGGCAPGSSVRLDAAKLHYGETTVTGSFHYSPQDVRRAAGWIEDGSIDPAPLLSGEAELSDLPELFERMRRGEGIKYVVRP
jgi:L-iditol 2-dehydrogenase